MKSLVEALGIESSCVPRIATGFGAGMGRCGEVCGAVTGAIMAIGMVLGRTGPEDTGSRGRVYPKVSCLIKAFEAEFGSVRCIDLIGCDLQTPEGQAELERRGLVASMCTKVVSFAAQEGLRLLEE